MQECWPPTTRLVASVAGASMGLYGLSCQDVPGIVMLLGGGMLMARGVTNLPARRIVGVGAGRRAVDVQKTININAPIERVFEFFANEWDADVTRFIPSEVIAWKSVERSIVENAGIIQFQRNDNGGTRVHIRLSYNPPGGAIGHLIAKAFGADPKHEMDQNLLRVKTSLETGHAPHDAAQPVAAAQTV